MTIHIAFVKHVVGSGVIFPATRYAIVSELSADALLEPLKDAVQRVAEKR